MLSDAFLFAVNGIKYRKLRSWLTILGIVIGISLIITMISLGEGMKIAVDEQLNKFGKEVIMIFPGEEANLLSGLYSKGYREFVLEGERGEIHDVISEVFDESMGDKASLVWGPADAKDGRVVLNLDRRFLETEHAVNVLHEIAI